MFWEQWDLLYMLTLTICQISSEVFIDSILCIHSWQGVLEHLSKKKSSIFTSLSQYHVTLLKNYIFKACAIYLYLGRDTMNGRQRGTWLLSFCVTRLLSPLSCSEVKSCVKLVDFKLKIYFMLSYLGSDVLKPNICLMPRKVHMIRNTVLRLSTPWPIMTVVKFTTRID